MTTEVRRVLDTGCLDSKLSSIFLQGAPRGGRRRHLLAQLRVDNAGISCMPQWVEGSSSPQWQGFAGDR